MAKTNYYGRCGSCEYCELGTAYTCCYSTTFTCSRFNRQVKATEAPCGRYEPDRSRTNDMIGKYDR